MIRRSILGAVVGGLVGLVAGPIVGLACGLVEVSLLSWLAPAGGQSAPEDPAFLLAFVVATILLPGGAFMGSLTGVITAAAHRPWAGWLAAVVVGLGFALLQAGAAGGVFAGLANYALPSVLTALISVNRVAATIKPRPCTA